MSELFTFEGFKIEDLSHHGVKNQKWGVRRYQNPDGSLTALGKARLERMSRKNEKRLSKAIDKKQTQQRKEIAKAIKSQTRAQNKELKRRIEEEAERRKIETKKKELLEKGDTKEIYKNRNLFTKQEIDDYVSRKSSVSKIAPKESQEREAYNQMSKFEKFQYNVNKASSAVETVSKGFEAYRKAAKIINAVSGKQTLPEFDTEKNKKAQEMIKNMQLNKLTYGQIMQNKEKLTNDQLKYLAERSSKLSVISKVQPTESKPSSQNQQEKSSTKTQPVQNQKKQESSAATYRNEQGYLMNVGRETESERNARFAKNREIAIEKSQKALKERTDAQIAKNQERWNREEQAKKILSSTSAVPVSFSSNTFKEKVSDGEDIFKRISHTSYY